MAKKSKFLMVSLEDDKAKKLASVLGSKTARKILEHLAEGESTEKKISKSLGIPISTVHYNVSLLVDGGLVETEEFHYSEKGRKVHHYKLANQYILIAPSKGAEGLKERLKNFLPVIVGLAGVSAIIEIAARWMAPVATLAPVPQAAPIMAMKAGPEAARVAMTSVADTAAPATNAFGSFHPYLGLWVFLAGLVAVGIAAVIDSLRRR